MSRLRRIAFVAFAACALAAALHAEPSVAPIAYPETRRVDHVDEYHGVKVPDPYRWLEDDARTSPEVAAWIEAQNRVTSAYLQAIPQREAIRTRLTALWDHERFGVPQKVGARWTFSRNDGLQNQSVVYLLDRLDGEPRVLFDPNGWSADGTVALAGTSWSDDGRWVAYGIADAGSDWKKWKIRDVESGQDLPETLEWIKFSWPAWTPDGKGLFYARYDAPKEGSSAYQAVNEFPKLRYHRLGTPQAEDVLVYHRPDQPKWGFYPQVSEDGRWLVISVSRGSGNKSKLMVRDLADPYAMPVELVGEFEAEWSYVGNDGPLFYIHTDQDAPRGRVVAIDLRRPQPEHRREIVPQAAQTLRGVELVGNLLVATYLEDAVTAVKLFDLNGKHVRDVAFPALGSAGGFGGKRRDTETFYTFSSFAVPPSVYRYDLITGESTLFRQAKVQCDPAAYETRRVFYTSKDGTRIPLFLCHKKGLALDGDRPTLLYGYGGFNIPMTPYFSISRVAWMEMGGVYAMACLRGGGEYGEDWHQAGTQVRKQNVFDDFIAAAEWLVAEKVTRPARLAIQGGSNGGLLVGACMTQRPELFGACLPAVGVMDMLRFHKFTIGWAWVSDYGSSDDPEQFKALRAYSPYHNLDRGAKFPPTLVTTADTDDRVVPGHSFKFAAALQAAQRAAAGEAPVLIRVETRAGHGAGTPTAKVIEEVADTFAFLVRSLGMDPPAPWR